MIGSMIADSGRLALGYAERLLVGVTPENFARLARPGGQPIESNHPAFVLGHLSLYAPRISRELGSEAAAIDLPEDYVRVFDQKARCVDDPEGKIYPPMEVVVDRFRSGYQAALEAVVQADDAVFQAANPNEPMRRKFPTLGSMHAFYIGGHMMMHLGQLSAWRRMMGLGSA